jgi:hypothetical protein
MSLFDKDPVPYGPSSYVVFKAGNDSTFTFITIAAAAAGATLLIAIRHLYELSRLSHSAPRTLSILVVCVPPLFALTSVFGLISPRGNGLFHLLRSGATVMVVFAYFKLIFWHLGGVTETARSIQVLGSKGHWLTKIPPCIPFRVCIPPIEMDTAMLLRCRRYVGGPKERHTSAGQRQGPWPF